MPFARPQGRPSAYGQCHNHELPSRSQCDRLLVNRSSGHYMTSQHIILQGGEDVRKRTNESLIRKIGELSSTKRILVIPWATDSAEAETRYKATLNDYFRDAGFREVHFLERESTKAELDVAFSGPDVLYLPGGDAAILFRELESRSIQNRLKRFRGTLLGNSAGAIVLSKGMQDGREFYPGFGLADFYVRVHFKLGEERPNGRRWVPSIGIPEGMWVTVP